VEIFVQTHAKAIKGFSLALLAATLWAVSGTSGQFLFSQRQISVEWLITVRQLMSGVIFLVIAAFQKNDLLAIWRNKKDAAQLLVFGIFGMLAVQYTYFIAIKHSNAATATILQYIAPVLIVGYLAIRERKWPKSVEYFSIFLALAGMFLLVTHGNINELSISTTALFWGFMAAIALALYTLQPIELLGKYSSTIVIGWGMLIGGVVFAPYAQPWKVEGIWDFYTYLNMVFVVVFGSLIAFYAYLEAVKTIGAQKTSLIATTEPISAAIVAIIWLQVSFEKMDWIGSSCIIIAILLLSYNKRKQNV
jgi:drug/metabolite transporter (DMT)-like permease